MTEIAKEIFETLSGVWNLSRNIPNQGHIDGEVMFTPVAANRLEYEENGVLRLFASNETIDTSRKYIYELNGDHIDIYYNDPERKDEIMHELQFAAHEDGYIARHVHECGNDKYDLTFHFNGSGTIHINYVVQGPKKDYRLESVLKREIA